MSISQTIVLIGFFLTYKPNKHKIHNYMYIVFEPSLTHHRRAGKNNMLRQHKWEGKKWISHDKPDCHPSLQSKGFCFRPCYMRLFQH